MRITFRKVIQRRPDSWFKNGKSSYKSRRGRYSYLEILTDQSENVILKLVWLGVVVECKHHVR